MLTLSRIEAGAYQNETYRVSKDTVRNYQKNGGKITSWTVLNKKTGQIAKGLGSKKNAINLIKEGRI